MLTWSRPNGDGVTTAVGRKGIYRIQWNPRHGIILTGVGHDEIVMLPLSPDGVPFPNSKEAKDYAAGLDRTKAVEPEISGA